MSDLFALQLTIEPAGLVSLYPCMYPEPYDSPASHGLYRALQSPSGTKIKKGLA